MASSWITKGIWLTVAVILISMGVAIKLLYADNQTKAGNISDLKGEVSDLEDKNGKLNTELSVLRDDINKRNEINKQLREDTLQVNQDLRSAEEKIQALQLEASKKNPDIPVKRPVSQEEVKSTIELDEGWKLYCTMAKADPNCSGYLK